MSLHTLRRTVLAQGLASLLAFVLVASVTYRAFPTLAAFYEQAMPHKRFSSQPSSAPLHGLTKPAPTVSLHLPEGYVDPHDTSAPDQQRTDLYLRRRSSLQQKLQADLFHREELDQQQQALGDASAEPVKKQPTEAKVQGDSAAVVSLRQQVATTHTTLQKLREVDTESHPDVMAAEDRLAELQARLDKAIASAPVIMVPAETSREANAARLERQQDRQVKATEIAQSIALSDVQISDDQRQLARLTYLENAARRNATNTPTPGTGALPSALPESTKASSTLPAPTQDSPDSQPGSSSETTKIGLSLIAGTLLALTVFFIARRFDRSVRDGATMLALLPKDVEYVGTIPRMS